MSRTRSYWVPGVKGSSTYSWYMPDPSWTTYWVHTQCHGSYGSCVDVHDQPFKDHPLEIQKHWWELEESSLLEGQYAPSKGNVYWTARKMPPQCTGTIAANGHAGSPPTTGFRNSTQAIAGSHPGSPLIELPQFAFELKDLPDMLKHAYGRASALADAAGGNTASAVGKYMANPKNPAEDYLNYQFGWKPFINDILSIGSLSEFTKKRQETFRRFSEGKKSRRAQLGTQYSTARRTAGLFQVGLVQHDADVVSHHSVKKWVVSKWKMDYTAYEAFEKSYWYQLRSAMGLDINIHHMWNVLPWSWLVDWCLGVGDVIEAHSNRFGFQFDSAQIMTHRYSRTLYTPRNMGWYSQAKCDPFYCNSETKSRASIAPSISFRPFENFFNGHQLGILAALGVTKSR